jgi:hypothetical protein
MASRRNPEQFFQKLFWLLAALIVVAQFRAPFALTLDGYSHLYQASVLGELWAGDAAFAAHFNTASPWLPNWLSTLLLAAIVKAIGLPWALAIFQLGLLAAFYFGLRSAAGIAQRQDTAANAEAIILLAVTFNSYFIVGFYNFYLSTAICLWVIGLDRKLVAQSALLLLAYVAHPLPVLLSGAFTGCRLIAEFQAERRWPWRAALPWVLPWALPVLLIGRFTLQLRERGAVYSESWLNAFRSRVTDLMGVGGSFLAPTALVAAAYAVLVAVLLVRAMETWRQERSVYSLALGYFIAMMGAGFLLVPTSVGDGSSIEHRFLLFAWLGVTLLAMKVPAALPSLTWLGSLAAALLLAFSLGEYATAASPLQAAASELTSAISGIPPASRVVYLGYQRAPECGATPIFERTAPYRHGAGLAFARQRLVMLNNYHTATTHFPIRLQDRMAAEIVEPFEIASEASGSSWKRFLATAHPQVDYVVVWGVSGRDACQASAPPPLTAELATHFERQSERQAVSYTAVWKANPSASTPAQ